MDHYYNTIDGWFDYKNFYKQIVANLPNNAKIVEIGAWKGCSTSFLAVEIINSKKDIELEVVDMWQEFEQINLPSEPIDFEVVYKEFIKNMEPVNNLLKMKITRGASVDAAKHHGDRTLDFVFIDGGHDFKDVNGDINAWLPKIKSGGTIAGHDYSPNWPGVIEAVNLNFKDFKISGENNTVWFTQIP